LYGGYFVTLENKPVKLDLASEAQILVFAPRPKDSFSSNLVNQLEVTYFGNESERKPIHVCLLAPDPTSTGWTMFARVWIAKTLQRKLTQQIARSLCQSMFSNPSATIKQLNDYWKEIPASIQKQANDVLVRNREVAKKLPGVHRYFQDGKGTNYEIDVSTNIWNFKNTFNEAHPERQLNR
jgi:hypothetical protein